LLLGFLHFFAVTESRKNNKTEMSFKYIYNMVKYSIEYTNISESHKIRWGNFSEYFSFLFFSSRRLLTKFALYN